MSFEVNLPRRIETFILRCAGMNVESYTGQTLGFGAEGTNFLFETELPYFLSERPVTITVERLLSGDPVRLRVSATDEQIEQDIRDYLQRYSAENDGSALVDRESSLLWQRIDAVLVGEGLSLELLRNRRKLNRRAIEALFELGDDVARHERETITRVFANGPVERREKELVVRRLIRLFAAELDPLARAQISLRIEENMVPAAAEDLIRLVQDSKYGESRAGLLMALARSKAPNASEVVVSVLREKRLAWAGIEALGKLKASEHVGAIRPFLRHENSDVRRQARKVLNKLGFPAQTPPKPVHLVREPKIPPHLAEWSTALDMDGLESTLKALAGCVTSGFGARDIAEVAAVAEEMEVGQTRTFCFPTVANGVGSELWIQLFMDDVGSPDLGVHSDAATIEAFRLCRSDD